jgi:hypothetical protein
MTKRKNQGTKKSKAAKPKQRKQKEKIVYIEKPMSIGARIGDGLQKLGTSLFTKFMGTGDYTCNDMCYNVKSNALIKGSEAKAVKMSSDKSTFVFEHSEYIGDVISSSTVGAFSQNSYPVNPSNTTTFPWLSQMGDSFESYEIEGMIFRFVSTSGESVASTNTAIGSIMGTFQYDTLDIPFISKAQLLQYDDTVDCRTSENFICGVECDKSRLPTFSNKLFTGAVPAGADAKLYNFGNFVIASQGVQAASVTLGELWVSYRIKMHITKAAYNIQGSLHLVNPGILNYSNPYVSYIANSPVKWSGSLQLTILSGGIVQVSQLVVGAKYLVTWGTTSSTTVTWTNSAVPVTGLSAFNYFNVDTASYIQGGNTTTLTNVIVLAYTATSAVATIGYPYTSGGVYPTMDMTITQLDDSILG